MDKLSKDGNSAPFNNNHKTMSTIEQKARHTKNCILCGKEKSPLAIICWKCFKNGKDPLKYSPLSTEKWLKKNLTI